MPLVAVAERGPLNGEGRGWYDRLECGHLVPFDGNRVSRRQCRECVTDPSGMIPLFDTATCEKRQEET